MVSSGQVLYRKWRPQRFSELVGQDHIAQTLRRAVAEGRVAHAYLFCGPRGTGKTSTARILAKAINCTDALDGEPDDTCDNCVAVTEGRMMDLIEIDAASNRGIDDIRSLRDKVQFAPSTGQFKVYIIDEVHMLTEPAFNALLKTLEEPPAHVVLVLATTEVQKVPPTIISRCQRYDFRRIPNQAVIDRLALIAEAEGFEVEHEVLAIVARAAWGSLRDAENVIEQLAISYGGNITAQGARESLGIGDTAAGLSLAVNVLKDDAAGALSVINAQADAGADLRSLQSSAVDAMRAALLIKAGVNDALSHPAEVVSAMRDASSGVSMEKLLHGLALLGEADLKRDNSSPLPLELAVVRAVSGPVAAPAARAASPEPVQRGRVSEAATAPARRSASTASRPFPGPPPAAQPPRPTATGPPAAAAPESPPRPVRGPADPRWERVLRALSRTRGKRLMLGALLRSATSHDATDEELLIRFAHRSNFERLQEELDDPRGRVAIEDAVAEEFGVKLKVRAVHAANEGKPDNGQDSSPMNSPLVRAAVTMGARIIDDDLPNGGSR